MTATFQIKQLIEDAENQLQPVSDTARLDTELLLCAVLKKQRHFLHSWPEHEPGQQQLDQFQQYLDRRLQGEPIAHILGERGFWSLDLFVSKDTLIPRPETELMVEQALDIIPEQASWKILDLGTGTGAIALSLAKERPGCLLTATDFLPGALDVARRNAERNQINNIEFIQSHWFEELTDKFNIIVSNPPYICENDPHLEQGDVRFEPLSALTSGSDGLDDIRIIIQQARQHLLPGGVLLLEHGYNQADAVCDLLKQAHYKNIQRYQDINNNPRVSLGYI